MKIIVLLLTLLLVSCLTPVTETDPGIEYTVQAFLTAGDTVSGIEVRKIRRYADFDQWAQDSVTYPPISIRDAEITLRTGDSVIVVPMIDTTMYITKLTYGCDHVVIPGAEYELSVTVFDTLSGQYLTFTSKTTVPKADPSVRLSSDTMYLDSTAIREQFWDLLDVPEQFEHLTLYPRDDKVYRLLEFTPEGYAIFRLDGEDLSSTSSSSMGIKQVPTLDNPRIISQLDVGYFGVYYEQYRLVVRQVRQEYVDLYREESTDKMFWNVVPTSLYPEGISNIEGANGIFTATVADTLKFYLRNLP